MHLLGCLKRRENVQEWLESHSFVSSLRLWPPSDHFRKSLPGWHKRPAWSAGDDHVIRHQWCALRNMAATVHSWANWPLLGIYSRGLRCCLWTPTFSPNLVVAFGEKAPNNVVNPNGIEMYRAVDQNPTSMIVGPQTSSRQATTWTSLWAVPVPSPCQFAQS